MLLAASTSAFPKPAHALSKTSGKIYLLNANEACGHYRMRTNQKSILKRTLVETMVTGYCRLQGKRTMTKADD